MKGKEQILEGIKIVSEFVVYSCTGGACVGLMRAVLPPGVNAIVKGGMLLGGMLVSNLVADKVSDSTDKQIDEAADKFGKKFSQVKHDLDVIREKDEEEKPNEEEKDLG